MVMATGSVCHQGSGSSLPHEMGEDTDETGLKASALHERLVAYVHALAGGHEPRCGVWVEHSYARARGAAAGPAHGLRVLLAPRLVADSALDVERLEPAPPDLPDDDDALRSLQEDDADCEPDDDWEARLVAAAPSAAHARLAQCVLDVLRRLRLQLLGGGRAADAVRCAARRLRLALGAAAARPAHAWLHAALQAQLPRGPRRLYDATLASLRRAAPRLAERVTGAQGPVASDSALSAVGASVGAGGPGAPWLLWVSCGRARQDQRWVRRLGALLHTRLLAGGAGGAGGAALAPDAWCGAVAGGLRAALGAALAEAGERPVVLGGAGPGAALAAALAASSRARALLLLAPPLLTAEGERDAAEDALAELRVPALVVTGSGAAQCWRGAAQSWRSAARDQSRRVLELRGADDWLRLAAGARRRRRLAQDAVDAAVAVKSSVADMNSFRSLSWSGPGLQPGH
ncbi:hypothetical protein HW555_007290 [Spodoptera exigua]|uniref:KAT8 regulatory NSL complex subunit 3 n=1 Tax=Spodoptera exigua TaxID=7107 RepID=A0A835L3S0_SPOEX|nr:hypothetical protein HW555_007290 [Spodoptera exigua]